MIELISIGKKKSIKHISVDNVDNVKLHTFILVRT